MLNKLSLPLIMSAILWASNASEEIQHTKKPPVDEGLELKPIEDKIKDITFVNADESNSTTTLSLNSEKELIIINFTTTSHVPLTCKVIRKDKEILSIDKEPENPRESRALTFEIKKSELQVDDEIIIVNSAKVVIRKIEVKN